MNTNTNSGESQNHFKWRQQSSQLCTISIYSRHRTYKPHSLRRGSWQADTVTGIWYMKFLVNKEVQKTSFLLREEELVFPRDEPIICYTIPSFWSWNFINASSTKLDTIAAKEICQGGGRAKWCPL